MVEIGSVVTVGDGRGFVVQIPRRSERIKQPERVVVTAAHCLPHLPPPDGASYTHERTYAELVGPLGQKPGIWAECYFADPVMDLAVLGTPDDQDLSDEAEAFAEFVEASPPLRIADLQSDSVHLLSLNGEWFQGKIWFEFGTGWLSETDAPVEPGMSGSPLIQNGCAVGVVTLNAGLFPRLARDLPARMLQLR